MVSQYIQEDSKKDFNLSPSEKQVINQKYDDILSFNASEEQIMKGSINSKNRMKTDYRNKKGQIQIHNNQFNDTFTFDLSKIAPSQAASHAPS